MPSATPQYLMSQLGDIYFGNRRQIVASSYVAPAAAAYASGDIIANSATAGSVTGISFSVARMAGQTGGTIGASGRISAARCVVSGGAVPVTNFAFDLLLFRGKASIPVAAGGFPADNAAFNVTAAAMKELVATIPFVAAGWRNQAGANAAAGPVWQVASPLGALGGTALPLGAMFDLAELDGISSLVGVMQAKAAWDASGVAPETFDFTLFVDAD